MVHFNFYLAFRHNTPSYLTLWANTPTTALGPSPSASNMSITNFFPSRRFASSLSIGRLLKNFPTFLVALMPGTIGSMDKTK